MSTASWTVLVYGTIPRSPLTSITMAFSSVLSDGHAVLYVADNGVREDTPRYWPGFVALWRGDAHGALHPQHLVVIAFGHEVVVSLRRWFRSRSAAT